MKYFVIIAYDIKSDKRRLKIRNTLNDYGFRVQYSVFECELSQKQCSELRKKIHKLLYQKEDTIRYYILDQENKGRTVIDGYGKILEIQDLLIL